MKNQIYIHKCPKCGREVPYRTKSAFDKAENEQSFCRNCRELPVCPENPVLANSYVPYQYLDELYSAANMNQKPSSNEVITRAFEGMNNPGYRPNPSTLEYYGGGEQTYNDIQNYLKKYNDQYLFNDLLRKTK